MDDIEREFTQEELNRIEHMIDVEWHHKIHTIRMNYAHTNAKFKVGDFIYNVTGIIKVKEITYKSNKFGTEVYYKGYRYKKNKGILSRTKDKKLSELYGESLKIVKYTKVR